MKNKAETLTLLLMGSLLGSLASCANRDRPPSQVITAQNFVEDQRRLAAELRSEACGPAIAPADYKRLMAAMAFKRERAQRELAQFAKFQTDQKLNLAEASAPKMMVTSGEIPSNYRQVEFSNARTHHRVLSSGVAYSQVGQGSRQDYPAGFYRRQMQEDSAAQAETAFNENARSQQQQGDPETPYAIPVPGRPGYVTMPPKMGGYIDVRGYAPGAVVMDPWTKTIIRVP